MRRPNSKKPPVPTNATASTIKPTLADPVPIVEGLLGGVAEAADESEELLDATAVAVPIEMVGVSASVAGAVASLFRVAVTCAVLVAVGVMAPGAVVAASVTAVGGTVDVAVAVAAGGVIVAARLVVVGAAVAGGGRGVSVGSFG